MKRPITGRSMDWQDQASSLPVRSVNHFSSSSHSNIPKLDDCEQPYNLPVWRSALLFPETPAASLPSCTQKKTSDIVNVSPPSDYNGNDSSQDKAYLYQELSLLYEKWSDEDGSEYQGNLQTVNNQDEIRPADGTSSSNTFHSELLYQDNGFHFQASSSSQESFENSLALRFNHLSMTSSREQLLRRADSTEQGTASTSFSQEKTYQSMSPSVTSINSNRYCVFCKKNGETREFYVSHVIKDSKGHVICPILRDYLCPMCGATGAAAHTLSYCPSVKRKGNRMHSVYDRFVNNAKKPWL